MGNRSEKDQSPIEVSDLLKLKRHEKPDSAFWDKFQDELQQKTLQSLVKGPPWYQRLPRWAFSRVQITIPLSATALLLFAFVLNQQFTFQTAQEETIPTVAASVSQEVAPKMVAELPEVVVPAESMDRGDASFVVAAYSTEPESKSDYTKVAVAKSMPSLSASNVRYVAGNFRSAYAGAIMTTRANSIY